MVAYLFSQKHIFQTRHMVNPSLGGTIKNHLKEWLNDQKWPNYFS
jgi:hypothetical protein